LEEQFVYIFVPVVEPELGLFHMEIEGTLAHASKFGQPHLGYTPEVFNAIDMRLPGNEFIPAMVHTIMSSIPQIHKATIGMKPITMNGTVQKYP